MATNLPGDILPTQSRSSAYIRTSKLW